MKHLIFLLLTCGYMLSIAAAAEKASSPLNDALTSAYDKVVAFFSPQKITLDTKLVLENKKVSSLYTNTQLASKQAPVTSVGGTNSTMTFYVDVDKMLGGKKLKSGTQYKLDSISWYGHPEGHFSGEGRKVVISNGEGALIHPIPETKKPKVTVHNKSDNTNFTFSKDDILEVTIVWKGDSKKGCSVRCYDAPPAPAVIRGTAFNLTDKGELPAGTGVDNKYNKRWRFNSPAVRIRATSVQEYDPKTLAFGALAILGLILIIKLLFGSKKD